ncbi:unnamed protein product, partial [Didymodactylos carnosus]
CQTVHAAASMTYSMVSESSEESASIIKSNEDQKGKEDFLETIYLNPCIFILYKYLSDVPYQPAVFKGRTSNDREKSEPIIKTADDQLMIDGNSTAAMLENALKKRLLDILELEESPENFVLAEELLEFGRCALTKYQHQIPVQLYENEMKEDSPLINLLKQHTAQQWRTSSLYKYSWFQSFLDKQREEVLEIYERVLIRQAENAKKHLFGWPVLSILVQFLYELDDDNMNNLEQIMKQLIQGGRQTLETHERYISQETMSEQLINHDSVLYLALQEIHRASLLGLMKKVGIINKNSLYERAIKEVADKGWNGVNGCKASIASDKFSTLIREIQVLQLQESTPSNSIRSTSLTAETKMDSISMAIESSPSPPKTDENQLILACVDKPLRLPDLVQAGELMYTNLKLNDISKKIVSDFATHGNFAQLIKDCLTPVMYLLKRQQSLDSFITGLQLHLMRSCNRAPIIHLKVLIHILLLNADLFLRRIIITLASKRNPVPLLVPSCHPNHTDIFFDIIHIWDHTKPLILSFGIGPCSGKSSLLNTIFLSDFEKSKESIYFKETIDIDFGYSFLPRRKLNIADTHGQLSLSKLLKIRNLFTGYLIHIEQGYYDLNSNNVNEYLEVLQDPKYKKIIVIRDSNMGRLQADSCATPVFFLQNMSNPTDLTNIYYIQELRAELWKEFSNCSLVEKEFLQYEILRLSNSPYQQNYFSILKSIKPLKNILNRASEENSQKYFALYSKFVHLCALRQYLTKIDFYGSTTDWLFQARARGYQLENELKSDTREQYSEVLETFLNILRSPNYLMALDILASQLRAKHINITFDTLETNNAIRTGKDTVKEKQHKQSLTAPASLELLWRNAIVCQEYQADDEMQKSVTKSYQNFVSSGHPFEVIDGDNFHFHYEFLCRVLADFSSKRVLVISIIGPQNSGKSTLLNYMFGTLFDVREGRCTRGIYASLVQSNSASFDYIMLIDTEGLLSIEKDDKEYDRRLVLFCLAVSHVVIVNLLGDMNETLKDMLTLCADSLKQLDVSKVPQPIIHFVLNQKADLNLEHHSTAIDKIVKDMKNLELSNMIDIRKETFHTLPNAYKSENLSNDTYLPTLVRTEPSFIERVQVLCGEVINSANVCLERCGEQFYDPPQWLKFASNIFDTIQKFPDLTYFKDITERRQDNEVREHIRQRFESLFTTKYRQQLIDESTNRTERQIEERFQIVFQQHNDELDKDLEIILKLVKASDTVRERTRRFFKTQIYETKNAWQASCLMATDKKKMESLVRDGAEEMRLLIDQIVNKGQTMKKEDATASFEKLVQDKTNELAARFNPKERLEQALKFVYSNYNIFEKSCLSHFTEIARYKIDLEAWIDSYGMFPIDFTDRISKVFIEESYRLHTMVTEESLEQNPPTPYSLDAILSSKYINPKILSKQLQAVQCDLKCGQNTIIRKLKDMFRTLINALTQTTHKSASDTLSLYFRLHIRQLLLHEDILSDNAILLVPEFYRGLIAKIMSMVTPGANDLDPQPIEI